MMALIIQNLGDVTVFRSSGRITLGSEENLKQAIAQQPRTRTAVLDLAETSTIDAAGIGALLSLREWTNQSGIGLKLMNLNPRVERLLELTQVRPAFDVCSVRETLDLMCRAFHQNRSDEAPYATEIPEAIRVAVSRFALTQ